MGLLCIIILMSLHVPSTDPSTLSMLSHTVGVICLMTNFYCYFSASCQTVLSLPVDFDINSLLGIHIFYLFNPFKLSRHFPNYYNYIYYTLHNFLLYKSNETIWMFYGIFADKGDNLVNNLKIYTV